MALDNPIICPMQSSNQLGNLDIHRIMSSYTYAVHVPTSRHVDLSELSGQRDQLIIHISRSTSVIMWNLPGSEVLPNPSFPFRETFSPFLNLEVPLEPERAVDVEYS